MSTHTIGFDIDLTSGSFTNTEYNNDSNVLRLYSKGLTYDGTSEVYELEGDWISDPIDLEGKYTSLENLAINVTLPNGTSYEAYTSTSDDNKNWDEFIKINELGKMMSVPRRFIKVKIEFTGTTDDRKDTLHDFNSDEKDKFKSNEFIEFNGHLGLKTNYNYSMEQDNNFTEDGYVFRKTIPNSKMRRIDKIRVTGWE